LDIEKSFSGFSRHNAKGLFFAFVLFSLIGSFLMPFVSADGIPIMPYNPGPPSVSELEQLGYLELMGDNYMTHLYVTLDFAEYERDEVVWIVPFEEKPVNLNLEKMNRDDFNNKFSSWEEEIREAVDSENKIKDFAPQLSADVLTMYTAPLSAVFFPFYAIQSVGRESFSGYDTLNAKEGIRPTEEYLFGDVGHAEVFEGLDSNSLREVLEYYGVSGMQMDFSDYLDKSVVVFTIKKPVGVSSVGVYAMFTHLTNTSAGKKLYFPSGTTQYWKEMPRNMSIKVKIPVENTLTSNIDPSLETKNLENRFFVWNAFNNYYDGGYEDMYMKYVPPQPGVKSELYSKDLRLYLKDSKDDMAVYGRSLAIVNAVPVFPFAVLIVYLSWFLASLGYFRAMGKKQPLKKTALFSLFAPVVLLVLLSVFSVVFFAFVLFVILFAISIAPVFGGSMYDVNLFANLLGFIVAAVMTVLMLLGVDVLFKQVKKRLSLSFNLKKSCWQMTAKYTGMPKGTKVVEFVLVGIMSGVLACLLVYIVGLLV